MYCKWCIATKTHCGCSSPCYKYKVCDSCMTYTDSSSNNFFCFLIFWTNVYSPMNVFSQEVCFQYCYFMIFFSFTQDIFIDRWFQVGKQASCLLYSCRSCFLVCSLQPCGHLLGKGWPLGSLVCYVLLCCVTFPCGVLGQVWYLIVSILDLCPLTYLKEVWSIWQRTVSLSTKSSWYF